MAVNEVILAPPLKDKTQSTADTSSFKHHISQLLWTGHSPIHQLPFFPNGFSFKFMSQLEALLIMNPDPLFIPTVALRDKLLHSMLHHASRRAFHFLTFTTGLDFSKVPVP